VLDTNDTDTLRYVAGRLRSTGQWDDLGLTNNPAGGGVIYTVLYATDGNVYVGGNFTGMDNVAGRDYAAVYDPETDTWATWGAINDFDAIVQRIIEGPDGTIYACGFFSTGGGGAADFVAYWNGAVWATLGNPTAGGWVGTSIWDMAFDSAGNLVMVGDFINLGGVANADYVGMWTGAAYAAVGGVATGGTQAPQVLAIDEDDNIYIGGSFLNFNGDADADCLAWYEASTTTWASVNGTPFTGPVAGTVWELFYDRESGLLYIGGQFTDPGGVTDADYLTTWNRQTFAAVGGGLVGAGGIVESIKKSPDGSIYISGALLDTAGDVTLIDNAAKWNGSVWSHIDLNLAGAATIYDMTFGSVDPVIEANFDVYAGFNVTGACFFSGDVVVTNDGTTEIRPLIVVERTGGTSALLTQIRNETTGKVLLFDYALLDGETLTIDPWLGTVESSFYGKRDEALLAGSNEGEFNLRSGTNNITAFVDVAGAPTITAYMLWRDKYWSTD
jgi:hypothetical protein